MNKKARAVAYSDVFVCHVDKELIVLAGFVCQLDTSYNHYKKEAPVKEMPP